MPKVARAHRFGWRRVDGRSPLGLRLRRLRAAVLERVGGPKALDWTTAARLDDLLDTAREYWFLKDASGDGRLPPAREARLTVAEQHYHELCASFRLTPALAPSPGEAEAPPLPAEYDLSRLTAQERTWLRALLARASAADASDDYDQVLEILKDPLAVALADALAARLDGPPADAVTFDFDLSTWPCPYCKRAATPAPAAPQDTPTPTPTPAALDAPAEVDAVPTSARAPEGTPGPADARPAADPADAEAPGDEAAEIVWG